MTIDVVASRRGEIESLGTISGLKTKDVQNERCQGNGLEGETMVEAREGVIGLQLGSGSLMTVIEGDLEDVGFEF